MINFPLIKLSQTDKVLGINQGCFFPRCFRATVQYYTAHDCTHNESPMTLLDLTWLLSSWVAASSYWGQPAPLRLTCVPGFPSPHPQCLEALASVAPSPAHADLPAHHHCCVQDLPAQSWASRTHLPHLNRKVILLKHFYCYVHLITCTLFSSMILNHWAKNKIKLQVQKCQE